MAYAIVTGCTNRKRASPSATLCAHKLKPGSLDSVVSEWVKRIGNAQETVRAGNLYAGRGFQEARKAALALDAKHFIVSAGLGIVSTDDLAPPYNLTISRGSEDCILKRLTDKSTPVAWWSSLMKSRRLSVQLGSSEFSTVIVALPRDYLEMVTPTLLKVATKVENLRILTRTNNSYVHKLLRPHCIAYDSRLDGAGSKNTGTLSDFIARCAHHFAKEILSKHPTLSAREHQLKVNRLLGKFEAPRIEKRNKRSDDEIKLIIGKEWEGVKGRSGKMLRRLRDELDIACEQSRFKVLFHEVSKLRLKP